ncbi:MAG: hypothetical protein RQ752_06670 [Thermohalobaculum sp.]|nr:hypothetical protein [Thermohalobaculum sp.]
MIRRRVARDACLRRARAMIRHGAGQSPGSAAPNPGHGAVSAGVPIKPVANLSRIAHTALEKDGFQPDASDLRLSSAAMAP